MGQAASQCRLGESTSLTCIQAAPLPCQTCSSAPAWRAGRGPWGAVLYWGRDRHSKYLKKPLETVRLDLQAQGCQLWMASWNYLTTGNLRPSVHSSTASSSSSSLHYMAAAFPSSHLSNRTVGLRTTHSVATSPSSTTADILS